ncbi:hypothetical protein ACHAXH_005348 [Discostella pseudostelligera]
MPRKVFLPLIAAATAAAAAAEGQSSSARLLIGDVDQSESENLVLRRPSSSSSSSSSRSLNSNLDILKTMLAKETFNLQRDECLSVVNGTSTYATCDIQRFPYCTGDTPNICFNRLNRQDAFWPDKHPKYYIDYDRVRCYPDVGKNGAVFACSSCSPGRWCEPEGRCILDETMYSCWAEEG